MTQIAIRSVAERPRPAFLDGGTKQLFIDGKWAPAESGETLVTIDPATEQPLAVVAAGGRADVNRAVDAARRAFEDPAWRGMQPRERGRLLMRIARLIDSYKDELSILESLDTGMPIRMTRGMLDGVVNALEYYSGWPTKICGETLPSGPDTFAYTTREPLGVCAGITPWNSPLVIAIWKLAPALACGNTFILKPAEQTPLTAIRLGELLAEADLPPGVVNIITGYGHTAGAAIAAHPGINKLSFTGSTEVGRLIVGASTGNLKRVTLELGGKSPNIVFADADLERAAEGVVQGFCVASGQSCICGTRILVHRGIVDDFADQMSRVAAARVLGDPFAPDTQLGPLASKEQFDRVTRYVQQGIRDGARVITGGRPIDHVGYFVEPTVFTDVPATISIAREEIFGPVAVVLPFDDEAEAVSLANDTNYGLAAGIWTQDVSRAHRVAPALRAGTVWVNTYAELDVTRPFGGYKESGLGRELGMQSLDAYTEAKTTLLRF